MNMAAVLLAPWRSTHRSMYWIMTFVLVCSSTGIFALAVFGSAHEAKLSFLALGTYCFGLLFVWAFWMPTLLLLAVDARQLRLAGVQRTAALSVLVYAGLSLLLPCALHAVFGIDPRLEILAVGLTICGGLAFALLPRYFSMWIGLMPTVVIAIKHGLGIVVPAWNDPRWQVWGSCLLAALIVLCVQRWRRLLSVERLSNGWTGPMVVQFRNSAANAWGFGGWQNNKQLMRQLPDWLLPQPDLRNTGPRWPVASLRVLLGRWYMPQTWSSRLRQFAWAASILALVAVVLSVVRLNNRHDVHLDMLQLTPLIMPWVLLGAAIGLAVTPMQSLYQCWNGKSNELPLLALVPHLVDAGKARQQLLRAALTRPLAGQALILLLTVCAAAWWWDMDLRGTVCVACVGLGFAGFTVAASLTILGNRVPAGFWTLALIVLGCMLASLSAFFPPLNGGTHPWEWTATIETWLIAAWLVFGAMLFWLGHRGWRGFVQRPHPFLPND